MKAFDCKMCGQCCKGEGGVFVESGEMLRIARFLRITPRDLERDYCDFRNGRMYIRTGEDGTCCFYRNGCGIHPVKPAPCRLWPFFPAMMKDRENWEVAKQNCPGVNASCTYEEFLLEGRAVLESEVP